MTQVVGIRFKSAGKVYFFDPNGLTVPEGADVIVETARGLEYGECSMKNTGVEDDKVILPLRKVVRLATEADRQVLKDNAKRQRDALVVCQQKAQKHKLDMKFIDAEITFDGSKMLFYFTADGRVDFRDLVKDLAGVFRTRIELRQIGVRDEAKLLGGLGVCGKPFCCSTFLDEFQPVSIKMAKEQSLSLNPTKISGTCGRLMCCLKFEQEAYEDLLKNTPSVGTPVVTVDGPGVVTEVSSLLRTTLKVRLTESPEAVPKTYLKGEVVLPGHEDELKPREEAPDPLTLPQMEDGRIQSAGRSFSSRGPRLDSGAKSPEGRSRSGRRENQENREEKRQDRPSGAQESREGRSGERRQGAQGQRSGRGGRGRRGEGAPAQQAEAPQSQGQNRSPRGRRDGRPAGENQRKDRGSRPQNPQNPQGQRTGGKPQTGAPGKPAEPRGEGAGEKSANSRRHRGGRGRSGRGRMGGGPRQPQIPTTPDSTNTEGGLSKGGYSSHYNEVD